MSRPLPDLVVRDLAVAAGTSVGNASVAPILASRQDSVTAATGFGAVEDIEALLHGLRSGSWVESTLGGFGTSLDILGLAVDPVGNLAAWGLSWLIEHVRPLREALDALAGDPDQIRAYAETWRNVSTTLGTTVDPVASPPARWEGLAALAYQSLAHDHALVMRGLSLAAAGMSTVVEGAGMLVATVRSLVRDLIAQFVATLAVRLPQWAAEAGVTLGIATPGIALQVAGLVGRYVSRVKRLIQAMITSMRRLSTAASDLGQLIEELRGLLRPRSASAAARPRTVPRAADEIGAGLAVGDKLTEAVHLTDVDRSALLDYTELGYEHMNHYLRNPDRYSAEARAAIQSRVDEVSAALAKLPPAPGTTYRSVELREHMLAKYAPGQVVTEHAFTSTSQNPAIAQRLDRNTYVIVTGRNGRDVMPYSAHDVEAEILYDYGTDFLVTSKRWDADLGKWVITMEEVIP